MWYFPIVTCNSHHSTVTLSRVTRPDPISAVFSVSIHPSPDPQCHMPASPRPVTCPPHPAAVTCSPLPRPVTCPPHPAPVTCPPHPAHVICPPHPAPVTFSLHPVPVTCPPHPAPVTGRTVPVRPTDISDHGSTGRARHNIPLQSDGKVYVGTEPLQA